MIHIKKKGIISPYILSFLALDKRMVLSDDDKLHLKIMRKGFNGEELFEELLKKFIGVEAILLRDVLFTDKGASFQVDFLVITAEAIYLYEVKNYEGDYQFRDGRFLTLSGTEMKNPLTKFEETALKMRQLLRKWNINLPLRPYLVFVNPAGTLYNLSPEMPILLPGQIEGHFNQLNRRQKSLTKKHHYIAEKFLREHQDEAAFQRKLPHYTYESLDKGMWCIECGSQDLAFTQRSCMCKGCGLRFKRDDVVVFHINELRLLFPDLKVKSHIACDWMGGKIPLKMVLEISKRNFTSCGSRRGLHFK